ncbi:hypothetical protein [Curtobacterium sp. ER1/6]|uniref:hypothetical protein n=1 Tax=Curtobacterium sp. ER1/6 TaxID=1891920 RepID=UPI00084F97BB|nr:hypothetical protein [Curtobacterium sp. ER1/6]OEI67886.1 hypothetical protein Cus16_2303 [Curtobacterium sp. ER1/6]
MRKHTAQKISAAIGGIGIVAGVVIGVAPADAAERGILGGWSERDGTIGQGRPLVGEDLRAGPNHRGTAESTTIGGTSHKRAHGWTTWAGVRHYTTAQLEHYWPASGVIATSGRKYGTGGTEAVSPWKAFNPNAPSNGNGQARTYYGR